MKDFYRCLLFLFALVSLSSNSFARVNVIHISTQNPACFNGTDGYVTIDSLTTTAPTGNYTISINTNPTQFFNVGDTIPLDDGNYTIIVRDGADSNIPAFRSFSIDEPFQLQTIPFSSDASCFGACDGSAGVIAFDGTPGYTYLWDDPLNQNTATATNLCAGTYNVTVTDANNCTETIPVTVNEPTQIQANLTPSDVLCFGEATGSATALPSDGSGAGYQFSWSTTPGNNTNTENGLSIGNYDVTITDGTGCSIVEPFSIGQPAAPLDLDTSKSDVSCFGESTGFVRATGKDGTSPYSYQWGPNASNSTNQQVNNLPAGTYSVTVTDFNGCTVTATESIDQPDEIQIVFNETDVDCFGFSTGSIDATLNGGFGNFSVVWSDPANTTASGIAQNGTTTLSGLIAGPYSITVTDGLGCEKIESTTISEPTDFTISDNSTDPTCFNGTDGTIDLTVSGATPFPAPNEYTYLWSDNGATTQDRALLSSGSYTVTITDANGCQDTETIVLANPAPVVPNVATTDVTCFGGNDGTANVTAATGGTGAPYPLYRWSSDLANNSETETGLSAGTYTVTITDANNCTGTQTFTISQPLTAVAIDTAKSDVSCFGESTGFVRATAKDGISPYNYQWGPNAGNSTNQQVNNLPAGTYSVTVTDATGCTATATETIDQPSEIQVVFSDTEPLCNGGNDGSIDATISGGFGSFSVLWSDNTTASGIPQNGTTTLSGLTAGNYSITVTDGLGCSKEESFLLTEPTAVTASINTSSNPSCNGASDGSATVNVSGGTGTLNILWDDPAAQTTATASGLAAGTYNVLVTDDNGCTATDQVTLVDPAPIVVNLDNQIDVNCFGDNTGALDISVSNAAAPVSFAWTAPLPAQEDQANLAAGVYSVTVTDNNNCTASRSFTITQPSNGVAVSIPAATRQDASCAGVNDGEATAVGSGGTPPYSFLWGPGTPNGFNTATINQLAGGTYTVTISDANSCTNTASVTINQPNAIVVTTSSTDADCNGAATGSVSAAVTSGGTAPFNFVWDDPNGTANSSVNALAANTYNVTVTDDNGCTATASATVGEPTAVSATINLPAVDPSCNGASDGSATVNVSGGTGTLNILWDDPAAQTTATASGLAAGIYNVLVTDDNGCAATDQVTLVDPAPIVVNLDNQIDVNCFGDNTGALDISVSNAAAPVSFAWTAPLPAQEDQANLAAGVYSVTVTDNNNCTASRSFTITQPSNGVAVSIPAATRQDASCAGVNDGEATAVGSGGTPPYSFLWGPGTPNGFNTATINQLAGGTYTVTISDANSCTNTASVTINQPNAIVVTTSSTDADCNGAATGSVSAAVTSGGTAPFNFVWDDPNGTANSSVNALAANTYNVTVTDDNGCTATASATVGEPTAVSATINLPAVDPSCNGASDGSATVNVSGGTGTLNILWDDPAAQTTATASGLAAGTYNVLVTDDNGCTATDQVTLVDPAPIVVNLDNQIDVNCFGDNTGALDISVSNAAAPVSFAWTAPLPAQEDQANLAAGVYSVTVTDNNNCTASRSFTITQPSNGVAVSIPAATRQDASCAGVNDGEATAVGSGGTPPYSFLWGPGTPNGFNTATINQLAGGTYTVTISDANSCTNTASVTINQPNAIVVTTSSTDADCNGAATGSVSAAVTSGGTAPFNFVWDDPNGTANSSVNALAANTYNVTVTDDNGCTATASATVGEPTAVSATINLPAVDPSCNGASDGSATVNVSGGTGTLNILWDDPAAQTTATAAGLAAGTYNVLVTDDNGCTATDQVTLINPVSIIINQDNVDNVSCFGFNDGAISITISGGTTPYNYSWDNGPTPTQEDLSNLSAGIYNLTVTDALGCFETESFTLTAPSSALSLGMDSVNISCKDDADGEALAFASGGTPPYNYAWSPGSPNGQGTSNITNLDRGVYTVLVTDDNGCTITDSVNVDEPDSLIATVNKSDVTCGGVADGTANVTIAGGTPNYSIQWSTNETTPSISGLSAGVYFVKITDANSCTDSVDFTINSGNSNFVFNDSLINDSCFGECDGFAGIFDLSGGSPPYSFNWDGPGGTTSSISSLCAGIYEVTISDNSGCDSIHTFNITEPSDFSVNILTVDDTCGNGVGSASLTNPAGGTAPYSFTWPGGGSGNSVSALATGSYDLSITDGNGCTYLETFFIDNDAPFSINIQSFDTKCFGSNDGEIVVSTVGGRNPVSYNWSPPTITGGTPTGISPGTYDLTVTDANNCDATTSVTINEPARITANFFTSDESCTPGNDGSASASVSGGTPPYSYLWSAGTVDPTDPTGATVINLSAGTYDVTITDAAGCRESIDFDILSAPPFSVNTTVKDASCVPGTDGEIEVFVTAVPPITYLWSDISLSGSNPTGLTPGTYFVTVSDGNGCTVRAGEIVREASDIIIAIDSTDESCAGADGAAIATASGGVPPYTYVWFDNSTGNTISGLTAGSYSIEVTDANGCTKSRGFTINPGSDLEGNPTTTNVTCLNNCDGSIVMSPSGSLNPNPTYTYIWSDIGAAGATRNGLCVGFYRVTVSDNSAPPCTKVESIGVFQPQRIETTFANLPETCPGSNDGVGVVNGTRGGNGPYTYTWGAGTPVPPNNDRSTGIAPGTYNVTTTDVNGCSVVQPFTINPGLPIQVGLSVFLAPTCNGTSDGEIRSSLTNAANPVTFDWGASGLVGANPPNVGAGTYSVTVTDADGCTGTRSITVTEPSEITATINIIDESCSPGNDGSIDVTNVAGGAGSYVYTWDNGIPAGQTNPNGLAANTYNLTITDANNCSNSFPIVVNKDAPFTTVEQIKNPECIAAADGEINLTVTGATGAVTFLWDDNSTLNPRTGISAGSYSVTITDNGPGGCTETNNFVLTDPSPIVVDDTVIVNESCAPGSDGSITITVSGGTSSTGTYNYQWSGPGTTPNAKDQTGLSAGIYDVIISDDNSCAFSFQFEVQQQSTSLTISDILTEPTCNGDSDGEIDITVGGAIGAPAFSWAGPGVVATDEDQTGLLANTDYTVTVTDGGNGCTVSRTFRLSEPSIIVANSTFQDASCSGTNNGRIVINSVTGGTITGGNYNFSWDNGLPPIQIQNGLAANTYAVTITDDNGCSLTESFTIGVGADFTVTATIDSADCKSASDGSITLAPPSGGTPPFIFRWDDNSNLPTRSNIGAGNYSVTITDDNGCSKIENYDVFEPDTIQSNLLVNDASCTPGNDGSADASGVLGGTPPYSWQWSNSSTANSISGLSSGSNFSLTITDSKGCQITESFTIGSGGNINENAIVDDISCNGQSDGRIAVAPTGGATPYTYTWSTSPAGNPDNISNLAAGPYSLTITDANACEKVLNYVITEPTAIQANLDLKDESCSPGGDGSADASLASGGAGSFTYGWSTNPGGNPDNINGLSAGVYDITITDADGCSIVEPFNIDPGSSTLSISDNNTDASCSGKADGRIFLTVTGQTGGLRYTWNPPLNNSSLQENLAAGTYDVTVTDLANNCFETRSYDIFNSVNILATVTTIPDSCSPGPNGSASATASGGTGPYVYDWPNSISAPTSGKLNAGSYDVTITDDNGCSIIEPFVINNVAPFTLVSDSTNPSCNGFSDGTITLTVTGAAGTPTFEWSDDPTITAQNRTGLIAGNYGVTVTDPASGCTETKTIPLTDPAEIIVSESIFNDDCATTDDGRIILTVNGNAPFDYTWLPAGLPKQRIQNGLAAGNYSVTIVDNNGCSFTDSYIVGSDAPFTTIESFTDENCGASDGTITIAVTSGAVGTISYNWNPTPPVGAGTGSIGGLSAGQYFVTITDAGNGCTKTDNFTISNSSNISITTSSQDASCIPGSDGEAEVTNVSGGTAPITYQWSPTPPVGAGTSSISGLTPGTYSVTVTDANGCSAIGSETVGSPANFTVSGVVTNASCAPNADGSISVSTDILVGLISYDWNKPSALGQGPNPTGLAADFYTVTVTSQATGCTQVETFEVQNGTNLTATTSSTAENCVPGNDGTANISVIGGTAPISYQWSPTPPVGAGTSSISGLSAGTYTVTASDFNGCEIIESIVVDAEAPFNLTSVVNDASCSGLTDGSINLTVTGSTVGGTITYNWNPIPPNGQGNDEALNLTAGNYDVTVTDLGNSCIETESFVISNTINLIATADSTDEGCNPGNDGTATATISGGTAPYTFDWNGNPAGDGTATITGLAAGNYTVTITDFNGCNTTATTSVNGGINGINYTISSTDLSCSGGCDGTAQINIVGGSAGYTFVWTPPVGGADPTNVTGLCAQKYFVTATAPNGCTFEDSVDIQPSSPILPNESVQNPGCNGATNGRIQLNPAGGIGGPYTFNWNPTPPNGQGNSDAIGLSGGTYDVTISDGVCDTILQFVLPNTSTIVGNIVTTDQSCSALAVCDGRAFATPSGGVAPYSYDWGPGVATTGLDSDTAISLCPASYTVTITDANGCSAQETFTISAPPAIDANFTTVNSTCNICNGSIEATVTTGTGPFTYQWFDQNGVDLNESSEKIENLCSGIYVVQITDASGCANNLTAVLNDNGGESIDSIPFTDVSCFNGNDGEAEVFFDCLNPTCSVEWFDKTTSASVGTNSKVSNLTAGEYIVEVTNGSGCKTFGEITINEAAEIEIISSTIVDLECSDGATGGISVNAVGGTGSLTFNWSPAPAVGQGTSSISNLLAGNYSLTVSDDNSCSEVFSFAVNAPDTIKTVFTKSDATCGQADGFINAIITGGTIAIDYQYQWFDGNNNPLIGQTNPNLSNVSAGLYALVVQDDNNCESRFTTVLGNSNGPVVTVDSTRDSGCFGNADGAAFITAVGPNTPFSFNWIPNGQTTEDLLNLTAGTYTVEVTDAVGCVGTETVTISGSDRLVANIATIDASCGQCNGAATATVSGGTEPYSYLWSNGSTQADASNLCNGTYSLVVTDANGCSETRNFSINSQGGPAGETVSAVAASCASSCDGSITVTPFGGTLPYTYRWQHDNTATSNSLTNLCPGTYFLQISDASGCSRNVEVDITSPNQLTISKQVKSVNCSAFPCDGNALLTVTGGVSPYSFNWADDPTINNNFRDGLCPGAYPVVITDANGCSTAETIVISNTGSPQNLSPVVTDATCFGSCDGSLVSNVDLSTSSFQWLDNDGNAVGAPDANLNNSVCAGTYILRASTLGTEPCESFTQVEVKQPDSITLTASIVKSITCAGSCDGEVFISTLGGNILYSYSWDDPNSQNEIPALGLCAGDYSVTATDANGCSKTTTVTLVDPPVLTIAINSVSTLDCSSDCDATADIEVAGGTAPYTFSWNGGQIVEDPSDLCFGPNVLTVTDLTGCSIDTTIFVASTDTVVVTVPANQIICDDDSIMLSATVSGSTVNSFGWFQADSTTLITNSLDTAFVRPIGDYTFLFIASNGSCSDIGVYEPTVAPKPLVNVVSPITLFKDEVERIVVGNQDPTYLYNWTPVTALSDPSIAEPITSAREDITYILTVTDTNSCNYIDSVEVTYTQDLKVPSGISPNADGKNDVWNIELLEEFPNASVQVYNRWGQLLFEQSNGYLNPWDGTYNGSALPIGTYYYVIDLKTEGFNPLTGAITIVK